MEISSYSQLAKFLEDAAVDIMANEVADKATKLMQENIDTEVYAKYNPMKYQRTGALRESVETGMQSDDTLVIYNSRFDIGHDGSDRNIPEIIETGRGYYSDDLDERIGSRPFVQATKDDLKNGEFRQALKDGFKARGIETD